MNPSVAENYLGHVVLGGKVGEWAHCQQCGEGLRLGEEVSIMTYTAVIKAFESAHADCLKSWEEPVPKTPHEWSQGRDTGLSSMTIYEVWKTGYWASWPSVPRDPSDFGRCYRLLKLFPEMVWALQAVASAYHEWAPLVRHWDELTAIYEEEFPTGTAPKLYLRMKALRGEDS